MKRLFLVVILIMVMPINIFAHPGRTDSSGCHYCRTNCSKWGLSNGEYHCHNGNASTNSNSSSGISSTITKEELNSDNTIRKIYIDGMYIIVDDAMEYETRNESVDIEVVTNNKKATYSIINAEELSIGENEILIEVEAEDGSVKIYEIKVNRLSNKKNNSSNETFIDKALPYGVIGGIGYAIYKSKSKSKK